MGQYHTLVNLDKKEYVSGPELGNLRKLMEQCGFEKSTATGLWLLLAADSGKGGGDAKNHEMVGRWAGDRISIIGDSRRGDFKAADGVTRCHNLGTLGYVNISSAVKEMLDLEFGDLKDIRHSRQAMRFDTERELSELLKACHE